MVGDKKYYHHLLVNYRLSDSKILMIGYDMTKHKKTQVAYQKSQEQLRNLSAYLESVREDERTRISHDIHDELGQMLSLLKIDLKWLENRISSDQLSLLMKIESMSKLIDSIIEWVHKISKELRPSILDNLGIVAAIEWLAEELTKATEISCKVKITPVNLVLNDELSTAVFRILQETLTNVIRHSGATRVDIQLVKIKKIFILKVKDNGIGISREKVNNPNSLGLIGIKERVRSLKGKFRIQGIQNKGTTLSIQLPLDNR